MEQRHLRLRSSTFFRSVPDMELRRIEERCTFRIYEVGESIITQGDDAQAVYFVLSGEARASIFSSDGRLVHLQDLLPGAVFGELAAIDGAPRSATVEARKTSLIASMPGRSFRDVLIEQPRLGLHVLERTVALVRRLTERVYEYAMLSVNERIQAELLRLAYAVKPGASGVVRLEPAPVHGDIANRVSARREAVAREMSRLSRLGLVTREGRDLVIHDVGTLAEMVAAALAGADED
ncbi:MAG: Crp/Fnr family transcriptional regulator [Pseudomonadota bacterium]